jgi:hypothetical protein
VFERDVAARDLAEANHVGLAQEQDDLHLLREVGRLLLRKHRAGEQHTLVMKAIRAMWD